MQASEIFHDAAGFIALASVIGIALLVPLYLSQRRDVLRLREWHEREPGYAGEELRASEESLDRAEAELEELLGPQEGEGADEATEVRPPPDPGATPAEPVTAAYRVTHERPALERITMERAALAPHPRWRRFVSRATQPRILVAIGLVALLLGGAAILVSEQLLSNGNGGAAKQEGAIDRSQVSVAVLNGTSISGLGDKVASDLQASGYKVPTITGTTPGVTKTEALYANGQKRAAAKVANDLGVKKVKPIDRESRRLAGDADVVVVVGEDRAQR